MIVELIASTKFHGSKRINGTQFADRIQQEDTASGQTHDSSLVSEFAGRLCYNSFNLPNKDTATNAGYLNNIQEQAHTSVMEHGSATFYVGGVSRSLLIDFRSHRHLSFSARSTRFVNERYSEMVYPPALAPYLDFIIEPEGEIILRDDLDNLMGHATAMYEEIVYFLIQEGATRKEAHEAARECLPGATATEFVVTGNHHAWRYVLGRRTAPGASLEIRNLANEMLRQLKELEPALYQDMQTTD